MARRLRTAGLEPRDAPNLQRFLMRNVRPTGRQIGVGSFGSVEELTVDGLVCAGKKLHKSLVEIGNYGVERVVARFVDECSLLSSLRHPHIVQFLGVCFLESSNLPVLVMEYLPLCLDTLLDNGGFPLGVKHSALSDVARGLTYLHGHPPPIIHRDLTARNVLLNSALVAKLADLGVARIIDLQPGQLTLGASMTQTPGTLAYMPPEALEENPTYSTTLDIFSFGHLALFTITEDFPIPTAATYSDPKFPGGIVARSELERRSRQVEMMHSQLGRIHPLVQLVTQCLQNDVTQRPTAQRILHQLERIKDQVEGPYESMTKLEMIMALREGARNGPAGTETSDTLRTQVHHLQGEVLARDEEIHELRAQLHAMEDVVIRNQSTIQRLQGEVLARDEQIRELRSQHSLSWRSCPPMPFATSGGTAVYLEGNVYIGGVGAEREEEEHYVLVYDCARETWNILARCPVRFFALAAVNRQLVLVGGLNNNGPSATIRVWNSGLLQWALCYPDMPTARILPVAVGYQKYLLVAGGSTVAGILDSVEVLNTVTEEWFVASPLPFCVRQPTLAVYSEILYLLGGRSNILSSKRVFRTPFSNLISPTRPGDPSVWELLPDMPLVWSTAAFVGNTLTALGGRDDSDSPRSAIYYYLSGRWTDLGDIMPKALSSCACAVLPGGELFLAGGVGSEESLSRAVFTGSTQ